MCDVAIGPFVASEEMGPGWHFWTQSCDAPMDFLQVSHCGVVPLVRTLATEHGEEGMRELLTAVGNL